MLTSWLKLLAGLTKKELTPDFTAVLIRECEYWIYRMAALDSDGLKFITTTQLRKSVKKG